MNRARLASASLLLLLSTASTAGAADRLVLLATTIGLIDAGVVPLLEDRFEAETGIRVRHVGAGTGEALKLAEKGTFDVVLAHARALEEKFVQDGFGTERVPLMYNDFLLVGPAQDPAAVGSAKGAAEALAAASINRSKRRGHMSYWRLHLAALASAAALAASPRAAAGADAAKTVILATTTSTQDTGLLDVLIPAFEKKTGYFVKTISVGTGQALAMGRKGEADVLLVHAPGEEKKVVDEGFGIDRRLVMHNDFVVVGPPGDPAKIKGAKSTKEAFTKIFEAKVRFLSRGDNSGTHTKEKGLWKAAGLNPEGQKFYQQTGLGMGDTLSVSSEKGGYTLSDRGTWLALHDKKRLALAVLVEGEPLLLNVYHVMEVNPAKWPKVNAAGARAFGDYVVSKEGQDIIGKFGVDKFGAPLFVPDAGKKPESLGL